MLKTKLYITLLLSLLATSASAEGINLYAINMDNSDKLVNIPVHDVIDFIVNDKTGKVSLVLDDKKVTPEIEYR